MSEASIRLQKELGQYNADQLKGIVRAALGENLEDFAIKPNKIDLIDEFMRQLERDTKKLLRFLLFVREKVAKPILRAAINDYLDESLGKLPPERDPYAEIVVFGEPFVDRQGFRDNLREFFKTNVHTVLGAKGERYSGRSHVRYFVQHVTQKAAIECVYIDPFDDNDVQSVIDTLVNEMRLPVNDFRDRMAQASTKTKGFVSVFRGYTREFRNNNQQWCIIFDHHDREEVSPEVKEFMETMVLAALDSKLFNVQIIMLGYGVWATLPVGVTDKIKDGTTLLQIGPSDVMRFLEELAAMKAEQLSTKELEARRDLIFANLSLPGLEGMQTMRTRLRTYF